MRSPPTAMRKGGSSIERSTLSEECSIREFDLSHCP